MVTPLVEVMVGGRRIVVELRVEQPTIITAGNQGPTWRLRALVDDVEAANVVVPFVTGDEGTRSMLATCGMFAGAVLTKLIAPRTSVVTPLAPDERAALDERFRVLIRAELAAGATADDVAYLLTRMLPEVLDNPGEAIGHVAAAYRLPMTPPGQA